MALSPGTRFGPYEISSALGAGGMGEVYRNAVRWAEEIMKENSNADSVIFDGYSGLPVKRPSLSRRSSTRGTDTYQLDLGFRSLSHVGCRDPCI